MTPAVMFRQQSVRLFLVVAAICVGAVCGSLVPTARNALEAASFVLLALPMGFAAVRTWRGGILLSPGAVEIRGVLRTVEVPLAQIEEFVVGEAGVGPFTFGPACTVNLRDGRSVISFIVLPLSGDRDKAAAVVSRMNEVLHLLRRSEHPGSSEGATT